MFRAGSTFAREEPEGCSPISCSAMVPSPGCAGESGNGKTSLLCRLGLAARHAGHVVFIYDGGSLQDAKIGREISRLLSGGLLPPGEALARVDQLARRNGNRCLLIIDAVNDFHPGAGATPRDLLLGIDAFLRELPADSCVRVACA